MQTYPKTPSQFRRQAEHGLRRVNPDETFEFEWQFGPKRVTWPTGLKGFTGHGLVTLSDGERRGFTASASRETGLSCRISTGILREAALRIRAARA